MLLVLMLLLGIPHPLCSKQSPAHVGMCPWCTIQAIPCYTKATDPAEEKAGKRQKTTRVAYVSAATHLNNT